MSRLTALRHSGPALDAGDRLKQALGGGEHAGSRERFRRAVIGDHCRSVQHRRRGDRRGPRRLLLPPALLPANGACDRAMEPPERIRTHALGRRFVAGATGRRRVRDVVAQLGVGDVGGGPGVDQLERQDAGVGVDDDVDAPRVADVEGRQERVEFGADAGERDEELNGPRVVESIGGRPGSPRTRDTRSSIAVEHLLHAGDQHFGISCRGARGRHHVPSSVTSTGRSSSVGSSGPDNSNVVRVGRSPGTAMSAHGRHVGRSLEWLALVEQQDLDAHRHPRRV